MDSKLVLGPLAKENVVEGAMSQIKYSVTLEVIRKPFEDEVSIEMLSISNAT